MTVTYNEPVGTIIIGKTKRKIIQWNNCKIYFLMKGVLISFEKAIDFLSSCGMYLVNQIF